MLQTICTLEFGDANDNSSHVITSLTWKYNTLSLRPEVVQLKAFGKGCSISWWHLHVDFLKPIVVVIIISVI